MQELLYLYGFVIDNNPDDYLMVCCFYKFRIGSHAIVLDVEVNSCRCIIPQRQFKAFPVVMLKCSFLMHRSDIDVLFLI